MREHVLAMKEIWTKDEAAYHGEFVKFDPVWSWPKPAQRPHPPIILGGETDHTLRRVVEYCDGWFPRPRGGFDVVQGGRRACTRWRKSGPRLPTLTITVFGAPTTPRCWTSYDKAGIQGALLAIPDDSRDEILRYLDKIAPLAKVAHGGMTVAIGLGLMDFPVRRRGRLLALGRHVRGGRRRFDLADRPAGEPHSRSSNA